MPSIEFDPNWNTQDGHSPHPNHESELSQDDMKALVGRILGDIPGMNGLAQPTGMGDRIWALAKRLQSADGRVLVRKGIHQRDEDVHFTLLLPPTGSGERGIEVFLVAEDRIHNSGNAALNRFEYKPTGLTSMVGPSNSMVMQKWPATFTYTGRGSHGGIGAGPTRARRMSIGTGVVLV